MLHFKIARRLSLCVVILCAHGSFAQTADSTVHLVEHAPLIDTRANEPIRILSMRIPFVIAPIEGKHNLSLNFHLGNVWNPSGVLEYPNAYEPHPAKPWEAKYHPLYSNDPQRYQFYSAD